MARLSIALFALLAVVAAVSAGGPAPGTPPPPQGIKGWIAQKAGQIKAWGTAEKAKLQSTWQHTLVPQIQQLKQKLGAGWQQKAPQVVALLKQKAGNLFDKAIDAANKLG